MNIELAQFIVLILLLVVVLSKNGIDYSLSLSEIREAVKYRPEYSHEFSVIEDRLADIEVGLLDIEALIQEGLIAARLLDPEKERTAALELAARLKAIDDKVVDTQAPIDLLAALNSKKANQDLLAKYGRRIYKAAVAINEKSAQ